VEHVPRKDCQACKDDVPQAGSQACRSWDCVLVSIFIASSLWTKDRMTSSASVAVAMTSAGSLCSTFFAACMRVLVSHGGR